MILLVVVAGVATTVVASGYNAEACKAEIMQEKLRIQEKFAEEQRLLREERMKQQQNEAPPAPAQPKAASPFGNVFDPNNLGNQSGTAKPEPEAPAKPASPFGNVFDPNNLKQQSGEQ